MQTIGNRGHAVRELGFVDDEVAIVTSSARPTIVQNYIVVAEVSKAVVDQKLRRLEQELFGDIASECVPVVLLIMMSARLEVLLS